MSDVGPWIGLRLGDSAAPKRILCYPHAGGAASAYASWRKHLPPGLELVALEPPGRWRRHQEAPFRTVADGADALAPCLSALLDRPAVLFGHSLGALVMFEAALRLPAEEATRVLHLAVAAKRAPDLPPSWGGALRPFSELDDEDLVSALGRTYGASRLTVLDDPDARRLFLATLRADLEADGSYRRADDARVPCSLSAWAGDADPEAPRDALVGWALRTHGSFYLEERRGGHFFIHDEAARFLSRLFTVAGICTPLVAGV